MLRLSRQARMFSPTLVHHRIWFRKFSDEFTPDDTEHDSKPNKTASNDVKPAVEPDVGGGQSALMWDRINRLDDKIHTAIKDQGDFKVDVTKSIAALGNKVGEAIQNLQSEMHKELNSVKSEMHKELNSVKSEMHKEFAAVKSDQKVTKWQVHFLFIAASSLVIWSLKDYIQLRYPALVAVEGGTTHEQAEAPQKHEGKKWAWPW